MEKELLHFCLTVISLEIALATWDATLTHIRDGYDPWWKMLLVGGVLTLCLVYLTYKSCRRWLKERDERILKEVIKDE